MNQAAAALAEIIVSTAFAFMATKGGVTVDAIKAAIVAEPTGNAARYLADLIAAGVRNADTILAGRHVTAATIA